MREITIKMVVVPSRNTVNCEGCIGEGQQQLCNTMPSCEGVVYVVKSAEEVPSE